MPAIVASIVDTDLRINIDLDNKGFAIILFLKMTTVSDVSLHLDSSLFMVGYGNSFKSFGLNLTSFVSDIIMFSIVNLP